MLAAALFAPAGHPHSPAPPCGHLVTAKSSLPFISKVWDKARWERGSPRHPELKAWRKKLKCAGAANRKAMQRRWQRKRRAYGRYRALRLVAPYPGGGTWWAIPWYIVACESGGDWGAYNPSGALGPYQLLGWGAPYPATTWHAKMANHRIAAQVYAGGAGAGNWVCA